MLKRDKRRVSLLSDKMKVKIVKDYRKPLFVLFKLLVFFDIISDYCMIFLFLLYGNPSYAVCILLLSIIIGLLGILCDNNDR
eukprot:UN00074